jgi:hypothetical protein
MTSVPSSTMPITTLTARVSPHCHSHSQKSIKISKLPFSKRPLRTKHNLTNLNLPSSFMPPRSCSSMGKLRQTIPVQRESSPTPSFQVVAASVSFSDDDESVESTRSSTRASTITKSNLSFSEEPKKVSFSQSVSVTTIPSRHQYSPGQRHRMWNSKRALQQAASLNYREWVYENRCWQGAVEDEYFVHVQGRGWIHPAHVPYTMLTGNHVAARTA